MNRRQFLSRTLLTGAAALTHPALPSLAAAAPRFFGTVQRHGRWWFLAPDGQPFFSLGLNHIDAAPLRYPEAGDLWRRKYDNRMGRWLKKSVRPDLHAWGFNSVGWVQEVVTRGLTNHRHSPSFTFEEYQWLDLPYCHQLPFADFHQWEVETRHPDLFSKDFEDWRDYVARSQCARMAADPKLIGYFYLDCPTWVHTRPGNEWKGPLFDPEKLKSDAGRAELARFAELTGKPVLLADSAGVIKQPDGTMRNDPVKYRETLLALRDLPACVGFHLCGAYLRNHARNRGLRAPTESPDREGIAGITAANRDMIQWCRRLCAGQATN